MKAKLLTLILVFSLLMQVSCKREGEFDENATIVGTWKPISAKATTTVLGIPVSKTETMNTCQQESRMTYRSDLSATETRYEDGSGTCVKTVDRNFTYTYNTSNKTLVHTFQDGTTKPADVISLTSTTLVVKGQKEINGEMYDVEVTNQRVN